VLSVDRVYKFDIALLTEGASSCTPGSITPMTINIALLTEGDRDGPSTLRDRVASSTRIKMRTFCALRSSN